MRPVPLRIPILFHQYFIFTKLSHIYFLIDDLVLSLQGETVKPVELAQQLSLHQSFFMDRLTPKLLYGVTIDAQ